MPPLADPALENLPRMEFELRELRSQNQEQALLIEHLRAQLAQLTEQFRLANHKRFAPSSERTVPQQESLFNEAEAVADAVNEEAVPEPTTETIVRRVVKARGERTIALADLPTEDIRHELPAEQRVCPQCTGHLHEMGADVREELKFIPAQFKRIRHLKVKYACRHCANHDTSTPIVTATMPNPAFPGSLASPSVVAHVMSQKYELALPLYRQEQWLTSRGLELLRQTLANWVMRGADLLEPVYLRMREVLVEQDALHADETPVQVLHEPERPAQSQSRMWVYCNGREGPPLVLYDYQTGRGSEHPMRFLHGFSGYLHVDGYEAYEKLANVELAGCFAHVRRYFDEALKVLPAEARRKATPARRGLEFCNRLFAIERELRDATAQQRYDARLDRSRPVLQEFHDWLVAQGPTIVPKSQLGKAVAYCLGQWPKLNTFLRDGRLEIDNNRCERAVKPFVIGRKNWLFANTPRGARSSAVIYSIVETAKENGLVPEYYLRYLFEQLPDLDVKDRAAIDGLLPWATLAQANCSKAGVKTPPAQ
jgi:transposase/uncharacterized coiled-coil protein SlyX